MSEAASSQISVLDTSGWTRVGGQIGSNPGGLYQDPQGVRWYLKTPNSDDHVRNELLANRLYRLAGAEVAELALAMHDGRLAVASRVVKGLTLADLVGPTADKARAPRFAIISPPTPGSPIAMCSAPISTMCWCAAAGW